MASKKRKLLFGTWLITFALGLAFGALSAHGILRASRFGEPVIPMDLSRTSDWVSTHFRVWGKVLFQQAYPSGAIDHWLPQWGLSWAEEGTLLKSTSDYSGQPTKHFPVRIVPMAIEAAGNSVIGSSSIDVCYPGRYEHNGAGKS